MNDYKKSAKVTLAVTYVLFILLIVLVITLPFIVTWYVERRQSATSLAAVIMLTCYPCVPFAAVSLLSLRKIIKSILREDILNEANVKNLRRIIYSCFTAGNIMLIAGIYYRPFFVGGGAAIFCALVVKTVKDLFTYLISEKENGEEK